jgi:hypothetical protein
MIEVTQFTDENGKANTSTNLIQSSDKNKISFLTQSPNMRSLQKLLYLKMQPLATCTSIPVHYTDI